MADAPVFEKGQAEAGTPADQLPQGAAEAANAGLSEAGQAAKGQEPAAPGGDEGPTEPGPVEFSPKPQAQQVTPPGEEDAMLFGPSSRPLERGSAGATAALQAGAPPEKIGAWLPALRAAASDPDAPPNVKELLGLVNHLLSRGA